MHYLIFAIVLYLFWLVLSGHYTPMLMIFGAVSVLLVVWFIHRMNRVDGKPSIIHLSFKLAHYGAWLLKAVVLSNIDVASRIWNPRLPISPVWKRVDIKLSSDLQKTLYANSITLTPGTLTTDVKGDHFMVHALSEAGIEDLKEGEMERRIERTGI